MNMCIPDAPAPVSTAASNTKPSWAPWYMPPQDFVADLSWAPGYKSPDKAGEAKQAPKTATSNPPPPLPIPTRQQRERTDPYYYERNTFRRQRSGRTSLAIPVGGVGSGSGVGY